MIDCRKCRDMMIGSLYGELGPADRERFEAHLGACPDCAAEYSVVGATVRLMDRRKRPDPGPEFWDGYWDRLEKRMEREDASAECAAAGRPARRKPWSILVGLPSWSYQAVAGAALIAAGIFIGRSFFGPAGSAVEAGRTPAPVVARAQAPTMSGPSPDSAALENAADVRTGRFIEKSQLLLLGLVNYDPSTNDPTGLDLPGKKAYSRELAVQAADIQNSLSADPRRKRLRELVADLQVIMMQIANLGAANDLDGVEVIRQSVRQNGIMVKIDMTRLALEACASRGNTLRPGSGAPDRPVKNTI